MKIHPVANLFPMMSDSEISELANDIKTNGLQQPIVKRDDVLIDGRNRLAACALVNVQPNFIQFDGKDVIAFIIGANLHRRHMTESQRAMVAARLATMTKSDAGIMGAKAQGKATANLQSPDSITQTAAAKLLNVSPRIVADAKLIARESPELAAEVAADIKTVHEAKTILRPHVANNTGDNEWYTPKPFIESALAVMGKIDLDPASTPEANRVVNATKIYTSDNNGLKQEWSGRLWLNPPYASDLVGKFIDKIASSVETGNVSESLVLVNNATETKWFARLASVASHLCFPSSRIKFWKPDSDKAAPLQGQCIAYIGKHGKKFCAEFSKFGIVAEIIK